MTSKPLLSICIPTYNRSKYLDQCLGALVNQERFDEIEVVISDNCSTDDTESVGIRYQNDYPNIIYFRNEDNVRDKNFSLALNRATGCLRKLTNDTVIYKSGSVKYMLEAAEANVDDRRQVYFLSTGQLSADSVCADTLDEYINTAGINLTWIRSLAIWEEDCEDLGIMEDNAKSQLGQIPFLLHDSEKHGGAVIYDRVIMDSIEVDKKNVSYGIYKVFYESFLGFIKAKVDEGKVSVETYESLRKKILFDFFSVWVLNREFIPDKFVFSDEDLPKLIEEAYSYEPYYKEYLNFLRIQRLKRKIKRLVGKD